MTAFPLQTPVSSFSKIKRLLLLLRQRKQEYSMKSRSIRLLSVKLACIYILILAIEPPVLASDHVDGEVTIEHKAADISDLFVFPSPATPGHLVMVLDVYSFVDRSGHFSDKVTYSFMLRRATRAGNGINAGFNIDEEEFRFDCTFETPHDKTHWVTCKTPNGLSIRGEVDKEEGTVSGGVRVFAGRRADPFLFDPAWLENISTKGILAPAENIELTYINVLSIVIEVNVQQVFGNAGTPLFAVAAETTTQDNNGNTRRRIDRIGRPEVTNAQLIRPSGEKDLRDQYNKDDPFNVPYQNIQTYKERLLKNIAYYDGLDGNNDWLPEWNNTLAMLMVNDFLVVDTSMPFTVRGYFDIENSMLRSQPHTRCGGRVPGDFAVNTLLSLLVNGGHGPDISGGHINGKPALDHFPYLGEPSTGIISIIKTYFTNKFANEATLKFER